MRGNLLIVDDEQQIRKVLPAFLTQHDYTCDTASGVQEAVSLLKTNDYDIVITDKNMPAGNGGMEGGLELIRYIKEHDPSTVVILMTGYATLESTISAMRLGAFDYIVKPFELADMTAKINRIREYQNFLNPEPIMNIYHLLHNEMLELLAKCEISPGEEQRSYLREIDKKFDFVFNTFKTWERIIINQREHLAKISAYAEQLIDTDPASGEIADLARRIVDEAGNRL